MAIDLKSIQDGLPNLTGANIAVTPEAKAAELGDIKATLEAQGVFPAGKTGADYAFNADALNKIDRKTLAAIQVQLSEAGIYVGKDQKHYADGRSGPMTEHAVRLAADPEYAKKYLSEIALGDKKLDKTETMKMQAALNRLGYDVGEVDGKLGKKTATALADFTKQNPEFSDKVSPDLKKSIEKLSTRVDLLADFKQAVSPKDDAADPKIKSPGDLPTRTAEGHALLRPDLLEFVERHPEKRKYMEMAFASAEKYGLDPNMFANQIKQESQNLNPNEKGMKTKYGRALGIAQILPSTGKIYGLSKADLLDPEKAIDAAAHYVADLKAKHNGSQELALIEYNGGGGAIQSVQKKLGKDTITADEWVDYMEASKAKHGAGARHTWRNQTLEYVQNIVPDYWSDRTLEKALEKPENKAAPAIQPIPNQLLDPASKSLPNIALGLDGKGALTNGFTFAASMQNDKVLPTLEDRNTATIRSFLSESFLTASTFPETKADVPSIGPLRQKDPALTSKAFEFTPA